MAFLPSWFARYDCANPNARPQKRNAPIAKAKTRSIFLASLFKFALMVAIPVGLLVHFGQPALRIKYTYSGPYERPTQYHECDYITLFDGWREVRPRFGHCPLVTTFPFKIEHLTGA